MKMGEKCAKKCQQNTEENAPDVPDRQDFKNGEYQGIKHAKDIQKQKGNETEEEN